MTGAKTLSPEQRKAIPDIIKYYLSQKGKTIREHGISVPGDASQVAYGDKPVWHKKAELDAQAAQMLHLPQSLWGPRRVSNDLMIRTAREISRLRKVGVIADWSSSKRLSLFRLVVPDSAVIKEPRMITDRPAETPDVVGSTPADMMRVFLSIVAKSYKDNTYKFALGKSLLDYCRANHDTESIHEVSYDYLADEFLKHYWYQRYRFKMKQDFHTAKTPVVIQVLEETFGEKPPYKFQDLKKADLEKAKQGILENVFGHARQKKGMVIQRFQRIRSGSSTVDAEIFYDYDDDKRMIFLKPEAHRFLRQNYGILTRVLLAEWVRYLERVNHGLPLLAAKLNDTYAERRPLTKYRREFLKYSDSCFYCMQCLEPNHIHVDHVIPWSYLFADEPWNLVLACRNCNLEKSDSLPREGFVDALIERDHRYSGMMKIMERSLIRLSYKGSWEDEIHSHYKICYEYGFEYWRAQ